MLPVLAMGAGMFFAQRISRLIGEHQTVTVSLLAIGLAISFRSYANSANALIASAVVAGAGVALIQALTPIIIKRTFKSHVPVMMGIYITAVMGGAALASGLSPFLMSQSGGTWNTVLASWSLLTLLALMLWISCSSVLAHQVPLIVTQEKSFRFISRAWLLGLFFGLGTSCYTCVLAWLAPYYTEKGWNPQQAGLILSFVTVMEVIAGLSIPILIGRRSDKRWLLTSLLLLIGCGFLGLLLSFDFLPLLWPCFLGLGIGGLFPISLIVSMDHIEDAEQSGALTAFVQGIGYLIASMSPLVAGVVRDTAGSFELAWWLLIVLVFGMIGIAWRFNPKTYSHAIERNCP
jgi:CP family cyanate transporter-like MFS transporter